MTKERKDINFAVVVPSIKLSQVIEENMYKKIEESEFKLMDDALYKAFNEILNSVKMSMITDENNIAIDFNDVKLVLDYEGLAFIGVSEYKGKNSAYHAIKKIFELPILDNLSIEKAKCVLINFLISDNYSLYEMEKSMDIIYEKVDPNALIIFGTTIIQGMKEDEIKIIIVITGLEKEEKKY
jgi:cell division protein FtsZ